MIETNVMVLGTPYSVKFGTRKELDLNEEQVGMCTLFGKSIRICTETDGLDTGELDKRVLEVITYEVFHAALNEAGIQLGDSVEEQVAYFLSKNMFKMTDNINQCLRFWTSNLTRQTNCDNL